MNTKHTPGPWKVITEAAALEVDVFEVAEVSHFRVVPDRPDTWSSQGDAFADARLMAAAPELLEALQEMVDGDAEAIDEAKALGVPFPEEMLKAYRKAIAAIAKATGGRP